MRELSDVSRPTRGLALTATIMVIVALATAPAAGPAAVRLSPSATLGLFERESDVGTVQQHGSLVFDRKRSEYRITASGESLWGKADAFHFVWRRVSGDIDLKARVGFVGVGQQAQRKAGLMVRAALAPDAPYADAVVHGDGRVALQYRETPGGDTREVRVTLATVPVVLQLERAGDMFTLLAARPGESPLEAVSVRLPMLGPVYTGLVVCSQQADLSETALFSEVTMTATTLLPPEPREPNVESHIEVVTVESGARRMVYGATGRIEAPNWSRDGASLFFNSEGRIYRIPVAGGEPTLVDTGFATNCNNDHGLSPDGKLLAISHHAADGRSLVYVVPATGGKPRLVTAFGPSYWHGWSPDGRTLAYTGDRGGEFDIYTLPVTGGAEMRLTSAPGLDDGPDYTPDGRFIYFNSERSGLMQIWRMRADGSEQTQVTNDGFADWFPHPSPDGRWLVFLSYDKSVKGHPPDKDVSLRIMPLAEGAPRVLVGLFGGQGTINVPSWSPDSREIAFVSYRRLD